MKLYCAGPMAGKPEGNFPAFRQAAHMLRGLGHNVVSPVELNEADGLDVAADPGHPQRQELLRRDLALILGDTVEAVVFLPGWESSIGSCLEAKVAEAIGKPLLLYPDLQPIEGRHPASARFHELLGVAAVLHDSKQADYGRGNDPFANVRASCDWGFDAWVGSMLRATDKVRRLQTFAATGHLANEGVMDAFLDLAVYALIAAVLYEEQYAVLKPED